MRALEPPPPAALPATAPTTTPALAGKYLTFHLGDEGYGLPIHSVQEIVGLSRITRVPRAPEFLRGVINLRGRIVPVIDLRLRFGLPKLEYNHRTCVIVTQLVRRDETLTLGLIVDSVCEVLLARESDIEPPPRFGASAQAAFIQGIAKVAEKVLILLELERLLAEDELAAVHVSADPNESPSEV